MSESTAPQRQWRLSLQELAHFSEETRMDLLLVRKGEDAHEFWRTPIGEHMAARAWKQWADARDGLESVSAADTAAVQDLQLQARVARTFLDWLDEMVSQGREAEKRLLTEERNNEYSD